MTIDSARRSSNDPLAQALRRGDAVPFEDIYTTYVRRVRGVCRRYLKDPRDVDEAVQDTFIKAYAALPRFNGSFHLGAWLARIAANTAMDVSRKNRRRPEDAVPMRKDPRDEETAPDESGGLDEGVAGQILRSMRADHARALLLRMEDASLVEVGEALGKTPTQAKALLHRARTSFRKAWQNVGGVAAPVALLSESWPLP